MSTAPETAKKAKTAAGSAAKTVQAKGDAAKKAAAPAPKAAKPEKKPKPVKVAKKSRPPVEPLPKHERLAKAQAAKSARAEQKPSTKTKKADEPLLTSRLATILIAPVISEKATMVGEKRNQVLFQVLRDATKPEIKEAVETLFKVDVTGVQTVQHKGKQKRFGKSNGRRDHVKKAYVSIAQGQELNFSGESA